jgi:hypothetical protein
VFDFTAPPTVPVQTVRGRDPRPPQQVTKQTIHTHLPTPPRPDAGPSIADLLAMQQRRVGQAELEQPPNQTLARAAHAASPSPR